MFVGDRKVPLLIVLMLAVLLHVVPLMSDSYENHHNRFEIFSGHDSFGFFQAKALLLALRATENRGAGDYFTILESEIKKKQVVMEGRPGQIFLRTLFLSFVYGDDLGNLSAGAMQEGAGEFYTFRLEYLAYTAMFLVSIVLIYILATLCFSAEAGFFSSIIFTMSPLYFYHIHYKWVSMPVTPIFLLACIFMFKAVESASRPTLLYGIAGILFGIVVFINPRNFVEPLLFFAFTMMFVWGNHGKIKDIIIYSIVFMLGLFFLVLGYDIVVFLMFENPVTAIDNAAFHPWSIISAQAHGLVALPIDPYHKSSWPKYPIHLIWYTDGPLLLVIFLGGIGSAAWKILTSQGQRNLVRRAWPGLAVSSASTTEMAALASFLGLGVVLPILLVLYGEVQKFGDHLYTNRTIHLSMLALMMLAGRAGALGVAYVTKNNNNFMALIMAACFAMAFCHQLLKVWYFYDVVYGENILSNWARSKIPGDFLLNGASSRMSKGFTTKYLEHLPSPIQAISGDPIPSLSGLPTEALTGAKYFFSPIPLDNGASLKPMFIFANLFNLNSFRFTVSGYAAIKGIRGMHGETYLYVYSTKGILDALNGVANNPLSECGMDLRLCLGWRMFPQLTVYHRYAD